MKRTKNFSYLIMMSDEQHARFYGSAVYIPFNVIVRLALHRLCTRLAGDAQRHSYSFPNLPRIPQNVTAAILHVNAFEGP